jgi:hypothetical protein
MLVLLAEALCVEPWVLLKDAQELMEETACPPATP